MTPPAAHYLTLLRLLSGDEVSHWRHTHDRTERLKPSRLTLFHEHWLHVVKERSGPGGTRRADATIGVE